MRHGHFREQQGRVDGFGRAGAQYGGEDGAGGDVDGDGEFGAGEGAVVEEGQDVQAGGVDLDLLARTQCHGGGEGPPLEARGHLADRTAGQFAGAGERGDEPVERGLGRYGHRTGPCCSARIWLMSGNRPLMVPLERPRRRRSASRTAATTRSSERPVGLEVRVVRWSRSPHRPCLR
ncbi:hypothetical protein DT87_30985 [Streptomyces sp. NTK 937]|nr:hypothetical protein DT87_30985 [Streptomyces sp. NTK 937]